MKIIVVMVFAALSSIFSIVGPKLLGKVTTKLAEGLIAYYFRTGLYMDFAYMGRLILLLVILYFISMAFSYIQSFIMSGVSMQVTYNLRKAIDQKISRLPLKFYDTVTHGEVLSRITNDVDLISQSLNQSISQLITSVATVIGVLGDDVEHQCADDRGVGSYGIDVVRIHRRDPQDISEIFQVAARVARHNERACGRDVWRTRNCPGL